MAEVLFAGTDVALTPSAALGLDDLVVGFSTVARMSDDKNALAKAKELAKLKTKVNDGFKATIKSLKDGSIKFRAGEPTEALAADFLTDKEIGQLGLINARAEKEIGLFLIDRAYPNKSIDASANKDIAKVAVQEAKSEATPEQIKVVPRRKPAAKRAAKAKK